MIRTAFYISDFESIDLTNPKLKDLYEFLITQSNFIITSKDSLEKIKEDLQDKILSNQQSKMSDYAGYVTKMLEICNYLPYDKVRNQDLEFITIPSLNDLHQKGIACWCFTNEDDYFTLSQAYNNASYQPYFSPTDVIDVLMMNLQAFAEVGFWRYFWDYRGEYSEDNTTKEDSRLMLHIGDLIRSRPRNKGRGIHIHDPYTLENLIECARKTKNLKTWQIYNIVSHMYHQSDRDLELNVYSKYYEEKDSNGQTIKICNFQEQDKVTLTNLFSKTFRKNKSITINIYIVPKTLEVPRESNDTQNNQKVHRRFILLDNTHIGFDKFSAYENEKIYIECRRASPGDWDLNKRYFEYAHSEGKVIIFKVGST